MDFCIRFSLYSEDHESKSAMEVNFQETQVTFFADLTDGFEIGDVMVNSKDRIERNASVACEIIAYECSRQNVRLTNPGYKRNQGREVRVCVELSEESKANGLLLDRINWFYWILKHKSGQTVRQNAIVFDSKESPDTLTEYSCLRGADLCPFNTILKADFFQWSGGKSIPALFGNPETAIFSLAFPHSTDMYPQWSTLCKVSVKAFAASGLVLRLPKMLQGKLVRMLLVGCTWTKDQPL